MPGSLGYTPTKVVCDNTRVVIPAKAGAVRPAQRIHAVYFRKPICSEYISRASHATMGTEFYLEPCTHRLYQRRDFCSESPIITLTFWRKRNASSSNDTLPDVLFGCHQCWPTNGGILPLQRQRERCQRQRPSWDGEWWRNPCPRPIR